MTSPTLLSGRTRALLAFASLLLLGAYLLPLWRIDLIAPQYPEGLGLLIRINTVTGVEPQHLENINGLNHYIGMQRIEPDAIPELVIMPWVLGALIVGGLAAAAIGRRRVALAWVGAFAFGSLVGLADFWKWQYDYGHNLDQENAPIKIPGMTYQPPLIGSKNLLNFTATSWPGGGGWLAFVSLGIGIASLATDSRRRGGRLRGDGDGFEDAVSDAPDAARRTVATTSTPVPAGAAMLLLAAAPLVAACGGDVSARPIVVGDDQCAHCHMGIVDLRFAAQVRTATGKVETYDAVECLVRGLGDRTDVQAWVSDFAEPGRFLAADSAWYVAGGTISSPMGASLAAFPATSDTASLRATYGGDVLRWAAVREGVRNGTLGDAHAHDAAHDAPDDAEADASHDHHHAHAAGAAG